MVWCGMEVWLGQSRICDATGFMAHVYGDDGLWGRSKGVGVEG